MALTDTQVRNEKPSEKPRKLADGGGLYLLLNQTGKYWRWKYRFQGKEKVMALGVYPAVSLAQARARHKEARGILESGTDPMERKKQPAEQALTFEAIARQWWAHWSPSRSERHANYVMRRLEADIFPEIGTTPIGNIASLLSCMALQKVSHLQKRLNSLNASPALPFPWLSRKPLLRLL